jgi:hypothetical protein
MTTNFTQIINMLNNDFTVDKIMVPMEYLVLADTKEKCIERGRQHKDLDIIPFVQKGSITGYWDKNQNRIVPLSPKHITTSSTNIFDLIDVFTAQQFFFVMNGPEIVGYVHRVDLNNDLIKIPFYILLQSLESFLLQKMQLELKDISLLKNMERVRHIISIHHEKQERDINLEAVQGLYLSEILELSIQKGIIHLPLPMKHDLEDFRNRVSHADRTLLTSIDEIPKLKHLKDFCIKILTPS